MPPNGAVIAHGGVMRSPEEVTLNATVSGVLLAVAVAAMLLGYAVSTGVDLASPLVTSSVAGFTP
jgi:hypothetical protein